MQIAWKFDKTTLKKMGKSALLLAGGAVVTYALDNVLQLIGAFGIPDSYKPVVLAASTWVLNGIKEWIAGQSASQA